MASQQRNRATIALNRHRFDLGQVTFVLVSGDNPPLRVGACQKIVHQGLSTLPHLVAVEHRRPRGGPAVGDDAEALLTIDFLWNPQHEVGKGQVGNELPVPYQQVDPLGVFFPADRLRRLQLVRERHRTSDWNSVERTTERSMRSRTEIGA